MTIASQTIGVCDILASEHFLASPAVDAQLLGRCLVTCAALSHNRALITSFIWTKLHARLARPLVAAAHVMSQFSALLHPMQFAETVKRLSFALRDISSPKLSSVLHELLPSDEVERFCSTAHQKLTLRIGGRWTWFVCMWCY